MSFPAGADTLYLRSVRLSGASDGLHARHRLETEMADVRPSALGLPGHALLLVRRLTATSRLPADRPDRGRGFAQSVSSQLSRCIPSARRPWMDDDATNANAVLFAGEAELTASLVRDWLHNRVGERWWWRSLLLDLSLPQQWLRRNVLGRGEVLAPAIALLAERSLAVGWVARLEDASAQTGIDAIAHAYALSVAPGSSPIAEGDTSEPKQSSDHPPRRAARAEQSVARARLLAAVPEATAAVLAPVQRRLLALALAATRASAWSRTPQLALALESFAPTAAGATYMPTQTRRGEQLRNEVAQSCVQHALAPTLEGEPPVPQTLATMQRLPMGREQEERTVVEGVVVQHTQRSRALARAPSPAPSDLTAVDARSRVRPRLGGQEPGARVPSMLNTCRTPAVAASVCTSFGGIFYLLNVALALGLYGDFTTPRHRGIALSPWDLLALVGKKWFGGVFVRDPVWPLLAALAGRRVSQPPGRDFAAPSTWHIDPAWLAPWGEVDKLAVSATRSRLCVRHHAGFLLFDVARDPAQRPIAQAHALCAVHAKLRGARLERIRSAKPALPRPGTARWLHWLLGFMEARLALSLGVADRAAVPPLLCRHAARVAVGLSDIDVELRLADLPLAIRIAGLDRDAGWIPAAGRSLRFQFA